jgi:hypothetical protein
MALSPVVSPPSSGPVGVSTASPVPASPRNGARVLGLLAGAVVLTVSAVLFLHFRPHDHALFDYPDRVFSFLAHANPA